MDIFAAIVGAIVKVEPLSRPSHRREDLESQVIRPARTILKFMRQVEYRKEFLGPWKPLNFKADHTEKVLEELIKRAEKQIAQLKAVGRRGARTDTDLKRYHVRCTDSLCAFFKHNFAPKRSVVGRHEQGAFLELVQLLANPIFHPGTRFNTVVREYVEGFNEAREEAVRERMA
jgi:hypothetical protein